MPHPSAHTKMIAPAINAASLVDKSKGGIVDTPPVDVPPVPPVEVPTVIEFVTVTDAPVLSSHNFTIANAAPLFIAQFQSDTLAIFVEPGIAPFQQASPGESPTAVVDNAVLF